MKIIVKKQLANKIVEMLDQESLTDKERRRVCSYATKLYVNRIKSGSKDENVEKIEDEENVEKKDELNE